MNLHTVMAVTTTVLFFFYLLLKPLDCGYTLEAILRVNTIYVSIKYKKKMFTNVHVPPVLLYNVESKVHGHNFIRHFLALISMFSKLDPCLSPH